MKHFSDLTIFFENATWIKYSPPYDALFLNIPLLKESDCKQANGIFNEAAKVNQQKIEIKFVNLNFINLELQNGSEKIIISELRATYNLKAKLAASKSQTLKLIICNAKLLGIVIHSSFELALSNHP